MITPTTLLRTLICIVSYEAENHIKEVLKRLPQEVWSSPEYHVLLSDDASKDRTVEVAQATLKSLGNNFTILKLGSNQGYGGNQKVCYRFAIEHSYDEVVLLHGGAKYAPELITDFVKHLKQPQVDVVLGSCMLNSNSSIRSNIPFYQFLGNLILARIQNYICQTKLSEFNTGFRAYKTAFLKKIPFERNSDTFHFDTEILLQALHAGASIYEFSIPTHYGCQICRDIRLKYAWDVIKASLRFRFQKMGLLISLKYPYSANSVYQDKTDDPYSSHAIVLNLLKETNSLDDKQLLDIGCGPGYLAQKLSGHCVKITGVDLYEPSFTGFHQFVKMDLDQGKWVLDIARFDTVLMLDIIEHLSHPEQFLLDLRYSMKNMSIPQVIISTPNIGFCLMRLNLLFGRFNYADRGILDITHKRLFTIKTLKDMLDETGYKIHKIRGVGVPFLTMGKGLLFKFLGAFSNFIAKIYPALFAFQVIIIARPKPTTYQLIENCPPK